MSGAESSSFLVQKLTCGWLILKVYLYAFYMLETLTSYQKNYSIPILGICWFVFKLIILLYFFFFFSAAIFFSAICSSALFFSFVFLSLGCTSQNLIFYMFPRYQVHLWWCVLQINEIYLICYCYCKQKYPWRLVKKLNISADTTPGQFIYFYLAFQQETFFFNLNLYRSNIA